MRTRFAAGAAGLALVALAGCGSSGGAPAAAGSSTPAGSASSASSGSSPASTACPTATPHVASPQHFSAPPVTVAKTAYTMRITFACKGTVVIAMDAAKTPATVNSFAFLAAHHWFDGTPCHRLVTQGIYVLQCGDPTGTGTGGPGYTLPDENLSGATYGAGTVAMANTGQPHTGGSQFFLNYRKSPLPPQYTPFGTVVSGLPLLQSIAAAGTSTGSPDGPPAKPVVISSLTVTKGAPTG